MGVESRLLCFTNCASPQTNVKRALQWQLLRLRSKTSRLTSTTILPDQNCHILLPIIEPSSKHRMECSVPSKMRRLTKNKNVRVLYSHRNELYTHSIYIYTIYTNRLALNIDQCASPPSISVFFLSYIESLHYGFTRLVIASAECYLVLVDILLRRD